MRGPARRPLLFEALERPEEGRILAGVCAGLGSALDVDVTLLRVAAILLVLAYGVGLLVYLLLWMLIPRSAAGPWPGYGEVARANLSGFGNEVRRGLSLVGETITGGRGAADAPQRRRLAGILVGGGALLLLYSLGLFAWLGPTRVLALVAIAIGGAILLRLSPELRR
jgi:phage shock protein PspC (stress-responsive transcriptional regulator)